MITTSDASVENLRATPPEDGFRIQPANNPLVAGSGLSILKKDNGVLIEWDEEKAPASDDLLARVREEFISRSQKDVTKHPQSARTHANLGIALMNQGHLEDAISEFKIALSINPHHYVAGISLAKIMVEQGQLDEAERLYAELRAAFPADSAPLLNLAFIAMKRFDFKRAELLLREAIVVAESAVLPKYLLGIVLIRLGKNREAISLLKASVRSQARWPASYQALGVAYAMAGDKIRAELNFKTALNLAPKMREAVHGLAQVLLEQGKASGALSLLVDYLESTPEDDEGRELLSRAYDGIGQHRAAAQQLVQVFNHLSENDDSLLDRKAYLATAIGSFFGMDRRDREAETWLSRAIKFAPRKDPLPYHNLGRIYYRSDRLTEAYRIISECKSLFPSDQTASDLLASIYVQEGFYDEAIRELEPIVRRGEAEAEIYNSLGCTLEYDHNPIEAERVLREGHAKYPGSRSIIHNLIYVLLINQNIVEARQLLEKYKSVLDAYTRERSGYDAILTATWGLLYFLEGKTELGIQLYKQASKIASRIGDRELSGSILQKMHIEVAKYLIKQRDKAAAKREISTGLLVKRGREIYKRELKYLEQLLETA